MGHDVFISYSTQDTEIADEVCNVLEENGLECWIAPRNIISGGRYAEEIVGGLKNTKIVVLIFSKNSQESEYVKNEIGVAFANDRPILSFRIDETMPRDEMEFFLKNNHWLSAYPEPRSAFKTLVRDASNLCRNYRPRFEISRKTIKKENDHLSVILAVLPGINGLSLVYMGHVVEMKKWIAAGILSVIPTLFTLYYLFSEYCAIQLFISLFFSLILWAFVAFVAIFILRKEFIARKTALKILPSGDARFKKIVDEILKRKRN